MSIDERLEKIEGLLLEVLVQRQTVKEFYEVEEFARLVGKADVHRPRMVPPRPRPRGEATLWTWGVSGLGGQSR